MIRLLLLLLGLTACRADPPPALRVDDAAFTAEQVAGLSPEDRALLIDLAAFGTLIARNATDSIVDPLAARAADRGRIRALPYELAASALDEASLREAYARDPEWELTVRHVVRLVPERAPEPERDRALEVAREARRRVLSGEPMAEVAAELSEEPGAARRGGLLEPGREGSWVDPFWRAALALRPGEVSPVVRTEYGFHVLYLEAREPVPFEEASRLRLLRRVVSAAEARRAMEAWVAVQPPVRLSPPAVLAARRGLVEGRAPDSLVLSRSPAGDLYTARDLALAWAALSPDERSALRDATDLEFGQWVEMDAREAFWGDEAERLGVRPAPDSETQSRADWRSRLAGLARGAGFSGDMAPESIAAAALRALSARGQEALITRTELPALRPLLRSIYPAVAASGTSSEMRNSDSIG